MQVSIHSFMQTFTVQNTNAIDRWVWWNEMRITVAQFSIFSFFRSVACYFECTNELKILHRLLLEIVLCDSFPSNGQAKIHTERRTPYVLFSSCCCCYLLLPLHRFCCFCCCRRSFRFVFIESPLNCWMLVKLNKVTRHEYLSNVISVA